MTTQTLASDAEKKSSPPHRAPVKRDGNGRFVTGSAAGPGAPQKDPAFKELCAAERDHNIEYLRATRDDRKADPWLRFEAVKLMVQYDAGKPALIVGGPTQINNFNNFGAADQPITVNDANAAEVHMRMLRASGDADFSNIVLEPRALAAPTPAREVIDATATAVTPAECAAPAPPGEAQSAVAASDAQAVPDVAAAAPPAPCEPPPDPRVAPLPVQELSDLIAGDS